MIITVSVFFITEHQKEDTNTKDLIQCLSDAGVVLYGSKYCPDCSELIDNFGGYDKIGPIYVECEEEMDRCIEKLKTGYVPEIQIKDEPYIGEPNLNDIAEKVGCLLEF